MIVCIYNGSTYCTIVRNLISFDGCGTTSRLFYKVPFFKIGVVDQASSPTFVVLSPEEVIVPCYAAFAALVSFQFDAPPDIFRYPTPPTRFVDGAIDGLDLIPPLVWDDIWEIGGSKGLFRCQSRQVV